MDFRPSSLSEWDRFDAELGAFNNGDTRPWLLTDRDCWIANPFYEGPPVPHPEDCESEAEYEAECQRLGSEQAARVKAELEARFAPRIADVPDDDDEIPF